MFVKHKKIAGILAGACLFPILSWAAQLQDIKFAELPGERVELRLQFDQLPETPSGYTIEQPARIVLDFVDVENALRDRRFTTDIGGVNSAVVVSGGERTRLIVNMDSLKPYTTRTEGNLFIVEVGGGSGVAQTAPARTEAAAATGVTRETSSRFDRAQSTIQDIDFRRTGAGEGQVIIDLSNPNVGVDIDQVSTGIEVRFTQTELPDALRRRLDVTDFGTPVQMISSSSDRLSSILKIRATGDYDYMAYQADNRYVISVKPLTRAEQEERRSQFEFTGEKLSLNFQNIEVRNVLQLIADVTNLNLVASDTVTGSITLRLENVPWDQALDIVLKAKGLDKRQVGNVLMVGPAAEIAERERQELATLKQLEDLAPLRTEYIRVRYANARDLFELFIPQAGEGRGAGGGGGRGSDRTTTGSILSERGHAIVDERTNSIILTDTEEKIAGFRRVIDQVDIPIRQVMIEARIVIANTNFRRELGASLGNFGAFTSDNNRQENVITGSRLDNNTADVTRNAIGQVQSVEIQSRPFYDLAVTGESASRLALNVIRNNMFLGLELSALQDSGYAEIVSQPKVITGDKQQASIESGTEIPYRDATAGGGGAGGAGGGVAASITFRKAVLRLDVTPQITPDDNIIMDLIITQDTPGEITSAGPTIEVTKLETQVLVPDGETVVLGGIFQNNILTSQSKVPLLGDIPVLGRLFRRDRNEDTKRELLIFVTPRIMSNGVTN